MGNACRWLLASVLALTGSGAWASFHTFMIDQVYSNADGTVQFVVLRETQGLAGQHLWTGKTLTSTHAGITKNFTFPANLPSNATAGKRVLIGTQGLAALGSIAPDYVIQNGFLATDGATLNYAGVDQITYASLPTDGVTAISRTGATMANLATNFAGAAMALTAQPVASAEFYHAGLDHYFISDLQPDLDALDTGHFPGWIRTGKTFRVYPNATLNPTANPVCRIYIPPPGDSHFFSASVAECNASLAKFPSLVLESSNAFYIGLPDQTTGVCPAGRAPVHRLWNNRADSNHRYTTDVAIKAQMITQGYIPEGYGPDAVIMCAAPGVAMLKFTGGTGAPSGALVSDGASTPLANYLGFATVTDTVNAGTRTGAGEVIAFSAERPVALQPVTWATTLTDQVVTVPFATQFDLPLTIWAVAGPFATTQQTALTFWQTAQSYFTNERLGVRLAPLEIVDATTNAKAATWSGFWCGAANANVAALQADIGVRPGRINVYLVNLVDGSTSRGQACGVGGGFLAVAAGSGADLLAHELGHTLGLEHIDDLLFDFNQQNIMHSASVTRQFLTEGQTFRAHLRPNSAINAVYGVRPGLPTRNCDRDTLTLQCPAIRKRLWGDGFFGPN